MYSAKIKCIDGYDIVIGVSKRYIDPIATMRNAVETVKESQAYKHLLAIQDECNPQELKNRMIELNRKAIDLQESNPVYTGLARDCIEVTEQKAKRLRSLMSMANVAVKPNGELVPDFRGRYFVQDGAVKEVVALGLPDRLIPVGLTSDEIESMRMGSHSEESLKIEYESQKNVASINAVNRNNALVIEGLSQEDALEQSKKEYNEIIAKLSEKYEQAQPQAN